VCSRLLENNLCITKENIAVEAKGMNRESLQGK
jgi:hypothetical protein